LHPSSGESYLRSIAQRKLEDAREEEERQQLRQSQKAEWAAQEVARVAAEAAAAAATRTQRKLFGERSRRMKEKQNLLRLTGRIALEETAAAAAQSRADEAQRQCEEAVARERRASAELSSLAAGLR
jgi:hypothetical protein